MLDTSGYVVQSAHMKATPIKYDGETNIFTAHGATIGYVIPCADGSGFYSSYGGRLRRNFMGAKHATAEAAEECIRRINRNVAKNTEVIGA